MYIYIYCATEKRYTLLLLFTCLIHFESFTEALVGFVWQNLVLHIFFVSFDYEGFESYLIDYWFLVNIILIRVNVASRGGCGRVR